MKAIQIQEFGGPEVLQCVELPQPAPRDGEVLVRLHAIGVNPVETYIRTGVYPRLPSLPYTPGNDGAGVVVETGQRVYLSGSRTGTYAEYAVASKDQVHSLPDSVSFEEGAALGGPYATAYHALFHKAEVKKGQRVLVRGASGAVGLAAVQLAKAAGCLVAGTASTDEGRALAKASGADEVTSHDSTTGPYDAILEMLANSGLQRDLEQCAPRGVVVVVGSRGKIEIDPRATMTSDLTVRGMSLGNTTVEERAAIYAGLDEGLCDGSLRPVIAQRLPLEQAAEAHRRVMEPGARGKIVLTIPS